MLSDELVVGNLVHVAYAVAENDLLEALIRFRVLNDAHERRQARSCAEQIQVLARLEIVQHQSAGRFLADDDLVAFLQMLQLRRQGTIRHLDAEELEMLFPVRAGDRVSAHERAPVRLLKTDHDELTVLEAQTWITGALETKEGVVPVMDAQDTLVIHVAHVRGLRKISLALTLSAIARHSSGKHNIC